MNMRRALVATGAALLLAAATFTVADTSFSGPGGGGGGGGSGSGGGGGGGGGHGGGGGSCAGGGGGSHGGGGRSAGGGGGGRGGGGMSAGGGGLRGVGGGGTAVRGGGWSGPRTGMGGSSPRFVISAGGGPWASGGDRGLHFTDRGSSRRDIGYGGHARHDFARHRFRGSNGGFGLDYYSNVNCYQWRPTDI